MSQILEYLRESEKGSLVLGMAFGVTFAIWTGIFNLDISKPKIYASSETIGLHEVTVERVNRPTSNSKDGNLNLAVVSSVNNLVTDDVVKTSEAQPSQVGLQVNTKFVEKKLDEVKENLVVAQGYNSRVPNEVAGCKSYNITYMDYRSVTSRASRQYALLNGSEAHTDEVTGIRMIGDRYCIALGSYYTHNVGQKVDLVFTDGTVVHCIVGDCKSDAHTDATHRFHAVDGSVAEFVVDGTYFNSTSQWKELCRGSISQVLVLE